MSERAATVYCVAAAGGTALLITSRMIAARWPFWLGLVCVLPLILWLIALLCLALPVLVVLRGFSTRRDDGSLPDEK